MVTRRKRGCENVSALSGWRSRLRNDVGLVGSERDLATLLTGFDSRQVHIRSSTTCLHVQKNRYNLCRLLNPNSVLI